ncbi:MAG: hypothetical protein J0H44_28400 [Alphaproteobacteria bacterium]|nr:hypothetical protein [Alphaproteobacteria bacterium]
MAKAAWDSGTKAALPFITSRFQGNTQATLRDHRQRCGTKQMMVELAETAFIAVSCSGSGACCFGRRHN